MEHTLGDETIAAIHTLGSAADRIANAIHPTGSTDNGQNLSNIESLSEAMLDIGAGLAKVAGALDGIAAAIDRQNS